MRNRSRSCVGPFHGGSNCTGPSEEDEACSTNPCPGIYNITDIYEFIHFCSNNIFLKFYSSLWPWMNALSAKSVLTFAMEICSFECLDSMKDFFAI